MILLQVNDSGEFALYQLVFLIVIGVLVLVSGYIVYRIIKWVIAKGVEQGIRNSKKTQAEEEGWVDNDTYFGLKLRDPKKAQAEEEGC